MTLIYENSSALYINVDNFIEGLEYGLSRHLVLTKIISGQAIITPNGAYIFFGRVYYFDASVWLFNHEHNPYSFHFIYKMTNALHVSCTYAEYVLRTFFTR